MGNRRVFQGSDPFAAEISAHPIREENLTQSSAQPTVYIVDDDRSMCESMCWLVETLGVPVKAFRSAASFLEAYDARIPGCLVVDVVMPAMSGLELQEQLGRSGVEIPVIIVTALRDVRTAVRAMKNGAVEFLEKPFDDQVLLEQIRRALALDVRLREERREFDVVRKRMTRLTPREREVLELVVNGLPNKRVASHLSMSVKTVEVHRAKIMTKMEVTNVAQLVRQVVSAKPTSVSTSL